MHLGEAERLAIYEPDQAAPGQFRLVELRTAPPEGTGDDRWAALGEKLKDCRALLVAAAGSKPQKTLSGTGLKIIEMEGLIDEGLKAVYAGQPVPRSTPAPIRRLRHGREL